MRSIIVCKTCRYSADRKTDCNGQTGGEALARLLCEESTSHDLPISIRTQNCLWACTRHCNVFLQDDQRYSYLAGDFRPTRDHARAILKWFDIHATTQRGEVPFKTWPDAIRGHFIARVPPARDDEPDSADSSLADSTP